MTSSVLGTVCPAGLGAQGKNRNKYILTLHSVPLIKLEETKLWQSTSQARHSGTFKSQHSGRERQTQGQSERATQLDPASKQKGGGGILGQQGPTLVHKMSHLLPCLTTFTAEF